MRSGPVRNPGKPSTFRGPKTSRAGNSEPPHRLSPGGRGIARRTDEDCLRMIDDRWYKNGVFYCLSVGTYMDANGDGVGDFKGLLRRLDYLHGVGITTIWLMPFQPSR